MKKTRKIWKKTWLWVILAGIGGFINDFFIKASYKIPANIFSAALQILILLCVLTFPWWKKPWTKYMEVHILGWLVVGLATLSFLGGLTSPIKYLVPVRKSDKCPTNKQNVQFGSCEDLLTMLSGFQWNVNDLWVFFR